MNFRNLSAWSIRNPVAPIVLFAGLVLLGIVSFMRMEVQNQPDMKLPVVSVNIMLPGAAPTEVETGITERIESSVRSISGVSSISSTSLEGSSRTLIEFRSGTNIDSALREVTNAINQQRGELPAGIIGPQIANATSNRPDSRAPHA